jgi:hypothetical protein
VIGSVGKDYIITVFSSSYYECYPQALKGELFKEADNSSRGLNRQDFIFKVPLT